MSKRQGIVTAANTRFAGIRTANGYQTNIGAIEREWQTTPLGENERTAVMVSDPVDTKLPDPIGPNSSRCLWALTLVIDAQLEESAQNAVEGRKAIDDIKKAIAVDDTWGGLAKRTEEVVDRLLKDKPGTRITGVQVIVRVITSRAKFAS